MSESRLTPLQQIQDFLAGTADVAFSLAADDAARYRFVAVCMARPMPRQSPKLPKAVIRFC